MRPTASALYLESVLVVVNLAEVRSGWLEISKRARSAIGLAGDSSWWERVAKLGRKGSFRPGSCDAAGALVHPLGAAQGPRSSEARRGAIEGRVWWGYPRYFGCARS